jgi:farnesyl-diphosphate farnesyltransferase
MLASALIDQLLQDSSRSFYHSIQCLPSKVKPTITLAYLLARATDTVVDSLPLSGEKKIDLLNYMMLMINSGKIAPLQVTLSEKVPEENLILHFPVLIECLYGRDDVQRAEIIKVLQHIIHAQQQDIERFSNREVLQCIETEAELQKYLYLIAGSVGEFWTRVGLNVFKSKYSDMPEDELYRSAIEFGKGLQLVNILRDVGRDIREGRCYFPATQLQANGIECERIAKELLLLAPVVQVWREQALEYLRAGWHYMLSVKIRRLRASNILALLLGFATLQLLQDTRYLEATKPVKVSRREVRCFMLIAFLSILSRKVLYFVRFTSVAREIEK